MYGDTVMIGPNKGYKMKSTFWNDFSIADAFGLDAIKDTYKRCFREWKSDYEMITELCIVMNWKCWFWYENKNYSLSVIYQDYYYDLRDWCLDNLKGDELKFFIQVTD